jgi:hypothetical protein
MYGGNRQFLQVFNNYISRKQVSPRRGGAKTREDAKDIKLIKPGRH